jgi:hypothetical protein
MSATCSNAQPLTIINLPKNPLPKLPLHSSRINPMFDRYSAELLLTRCRGDEVWSLDHAREMGVPESWISELSDCYESGFDSNQNTLYTDSGLVNQYHGIADLNVAYRAAEYLGINTEHSRRGSSSRLDRECSPEN